MITAYKRKKLWQISHRQGEVTAYNTGIHQKLSATKPRANANYITLGKVDFEHMFTQIKFL